MCLSAIAKAHHFFNGCWIYLKNRWLDPCKRGKIVFFSKPKDVRIVEWWYLFCSKLGAFDKRECLFGFGVLLFQCLYSFLFHCFSGMNDIWYVTICNTHPFSIIDMILSFSLMMTLLLKFQSEFTRQSIRMRIQLW